MPDLDGGLLPPMGRMTPDQALAAAGCRPGGVRADAISADTPPSPQRLTAPRP